MNKLLQTPPLKIGTLTYILSSIFGFYLDQNFGWIAASCVSAKKNGSEVNLCDHIHPVNQSAMLQPKNRNQHKLKVPHRSFKAHWYVPQETHHTGRCFHTGFNSRTNMIWMESHWDGNILWKLVNPSSRREFTLKKIRQTEWRHIALVHTLDCLTSV